MKLKRFENLDIDPFDEEEWNEMDVENVEIRNEPTLQYIIDNVSNYFKTNFHNEENDIPEKEDDDIVVNDYDNRTKPHLSISYNNKSIEIYPYKDIYHPYTDVLPNPSWNNENPQQISYIVIKKENGNLTNFVNYNWTDENGLNYLSKSIDKFLLKGFMTKVTKFGDYIIGNYKDSGTHYAGPR